MSDNVAVVTVHGMGDVEANYADKIENELKNSLQNDWDRIHFENIYYADVFQKFQNTLFDRYKKNDDIDWLRLRKFLMCGFSDAAGFERNSSQEGSPYEQVQNKILDSLDNVYSAVGGDVKIVLIAHSLGCHVISNFIWDAQSIDPKQGAWRYGGFEDSPSGSELDSVRKLKPLKYLYFTGCNIPIFVAGIPQSKIKAIASTSKGYSFKWKNYFDPDDPLGWPLKNLNTKSERQSYKYEVNEDNAINAGWFIRGWNPLSHTAYWSDNSVLEPLVEDIESLLK